MADDNDTSKGFISAQELWKRVATRGDLATVLIAGPVGFVGDIALSLTGFVSPGTCAVLTASTALGVKNALQSRLVAVKADQENRSGNEMLPISSSYSDARRRAHRLYEKLVNNSKRMDGKNETLASEAAKLEVEIGLHEDGLSDDQTLSAAIERGLEVYRSAMTKGTTRGPVKSGSRSMLLDDA